MGLFLRVFYLPYYRGFWHPCDSQRWWFVRHGITNFINFRDLQAQGAGDTANSETGKRREEQSNSETGI